MRRNAYLHVALFAALMALTSVHAATGGNFQVNATITNGCQINNTVPTNGAALGNFGTVNFGSDSALSTAVKTGTFTGSLVLSCTPSIGLNMRIDGGANYSAVRRMKNMGSSSAIGYQLYRDAAMTQSIGVNQLVSVNTATTPSSIALPVYGRLTLPGNVPAGTYQDTLTVTLEW